jgi:6-phosphogluconolactonase
MEPLRVFHGPELMAKEIALQLKGYANQAEKDGNIFSIVLSGGSTVTRLYGAFVERSSVDKIPWHIIHLFWADERCVSPENEESNYGTCRSVLLDHIPIPKENIHRIRGEEDPLKESAHYAREMQNHMKFRKGQSNLFDWVFLGVGVDGHTASLFSGHDTLYSSNLCEMVRHPQTAQIRITMTPFAIRQSNRITYHVVGRDKSDIISELVSQIGSHVNYPAAHIAGEWYLDSKAASKINSKTIGL